MTEQTETKSTEESSKSRLSIFGSHLDVLRFCEIFEISKRTADRWHQLRQGPRRIRVGRKAYYRLSTVEAWLLSREEPETGKKRRG